MRAALGLRSTAQSLGWIAAEVGIFDALGIRFRIAKHETAAPTGIAGLLSGDWAFAELGAVPIIQSVIDGQDPVILLAPEPAAALYVLGAAAIREPGTLTGGRIGVLSASGQTGVSAGMILQRWGLRDRVEIVALGTYPRIYDALRDGDIEAGVLTADYRIAGAQALGLNRLADLGELLAFQGSTLATTRRFIDRHPDVVTRVVEGYVAVIAFFKTEPKTVVPLLQRLLGFDDRGVVEAIYRFYADRFQTVPTPSEVGIERAITELCGDGGLGIADVTDLSFLESVTASRTKPPGLKR